MIGSKSNRAASLIIRRVTAALFFAAALAITPTVPGFAEAPVYSGPPITLEIVDADLRTLLTTFSDITDLVFVVDPQTVETGALDLLVTADYEMIPWDQALDEILAASGLTWTLEGKVLWIHHPDSRPGGDRNFTGDAINLRLEDAKLADFLTTLPKLTGLEIDFDPDIETTVSVALRSIPWDQVLDLILRISGFEYSEKGNGIEVFRVTDTEGMQLIAGSIESS